MTSEGTISILSPYPADQFPREVEPVPPHIADLNLDQVIEALVAGRTDHELAPLFAEQLDDADVIAYRQEVFADLETDALCDMTFEFARRMAAVRTSMAQVARLHHPREQQGWFLDIVDAYCETVGLLADALTGNALRSRALLHLHAFVTRYVTSPGFEALRAGSSRVRQMLADVHYTIAVRGGHVTVGRFEGEDDYRAEVLSTFARFTTAVDGGIRVRHRQPVELNHVEAHILDLVAELYPDIFAELERFFRHHQDFLEPTVVRLERELHFYLAYLEYLRPLHLAGLSTCLPEVTSRSAGIVVRDSFDLALASKLVAAGQSVVTNDLTVTDPERILVVSGPNQGGKTTFARMVGQLHHLACIGCPVPGTTARLQLCDRILTQFEGTGAGTGRLEDDLRRLQRLLATATSDSLVILNEVFSSTALDDAVFLGTKLMERLVELNVLSVLVTFLDELASYGPSIVSLVAAVAPEDPARRTYQVLRRPADGLAHALALAARHGLTYEMLRSRVQR